MKRVILALLALAIASTAQAQTRSGFQFLTTASTALRVCTNLKGMQPETIGADIAGTTYTRLDGRITLQTGRAACRNPQLVTAGYYVAQNNGTQTPVGETALPNDQFVEAAFEVGGANTGARTIGGAAKWNLPRGVGLQYTDKAGDVLPAASQMFLRYSQSIDATTKSMVRGYNAGPSNFLNQVSFSNNASGQTGGTGSLTVANASGSAWQPITIIGEPVGSQTAVCTIGMSITGGTGDTAPNTYGSYGWIAKGLDLVSPNIPRLSLSRGSSQTPDFLNYAQLRQQLLGYCDAVIYDYGTNDIALGGVTLATLQAQAGQIWGQIKAQGKPIHAVTMMPRTTSTDSWATLANQTPVTGFAAGGVRDQYNAWLYTKLQDGTLASLTDPSGGRYAIGPAGSWITVANGNVEDQTSPNRFVVTNGAATIDGTHLSATTGTNAVARAAATMSAAATAMGW